jgi:hypothetical protein
LISAPASTIFATSVLSKFSMAQKSAATGRQGAALKAGRFQSSDHLTWGFAEAIRSESGANRRALRMELVIYLL